MFGPFGPGSFGLGYDLDAPEELDTGKMFANASTAAEKAAAMVESARYGFYAARAVYMECRIGGRRYQAMLDGFGEKSAESLARGQTEYFQQLCKSALLDEDGNTTDETIPTTRMVNAELRRLRGNAHLTVAQHMHYFLSMMPESVKDWNRAEYILNGQDLISRYTTGCYQDFHSFLSTFKKKPVSTAKLQQRFEAFFDKRLEYGDDSVFVCDQLRSELAEFICSALPHNEARLQKEAAAAASAGAVH